MEKKQNGRTDAGLRSLNHYQHRLPKWRYWPRQKILPLIRYETPYLAWLQEKMRTPTLDSYFAFTANLGTHTFFTIFLPILFWSGYSTLGRGMLNVLAAGVFWSGFIKDLLCLPRPLSPPLQRITMSGSAALEYGFPSTHSTNAISVAIYAIALLRSAENTMSPLVNSAAQAALYVYAVSIIVGRLYCGMHGFLDVIIGSGLGALIAWVQCQYGLLFDSWIIAATGKQIVLVILIVLVLVRLHPEPADDCPCYDDSVSFAGVFIGAQIASWDFAQSPLAWPEPSPDTIPYRLEAVGWPKTILRIVIGVFAVFAWREVMKPLLLRILPPVFRGLSKAGLLLPRRFFTQASEYEKVPQLLKDNDVIPSVSDIPSLFTSIRHPRRRAVSIGPQSEADAYETLAYREKRRRESVGEQSQKLTAEGSVLTNRTPSKLEQYENMMGTGSPQRNPETLAPPETDTGADVVPAPPQTTNDMHSDEQDMFSMIKKPRVRYDVEVVTKLIVYIGIAVIVIDFSPYVFDSLGLAP
ncbi:Dihydrosphingosine 1-phosphate phosphatase C823,11 [Talaromyces islandicus]|uniref:Dihydrosphingosine 1-phosphate phosphatase C823,11 n=1 Tax=Talaromyces islandicus TaxID=28573 RepID=A0A0U1LNC8_TALIS|nr:Dihydrosphingosine 1-phosphate phosphatase C823,11 [Talaromyces islandicus]